MGVKYAAQLLSLTVAKALDFLREKGYEKFQGSEATSQFIKNFDLIFDLQNSSKRFCVKDSQKPFDPKHYALIDELCGYISKLRDNKGKLLIQTQKKTGFLGNYFNLEQICLTIP